MQRWWSCWFKNSFHPNDSRQTRLKTSLYFSVIKAGFCWFYISVSVQARYILGLFSQYLCKTKDYSYCCTRHWGSGSPRLTPCHWTQPCSLLCPLNRSIPPQTLLHFAIDSPRGCPALATLISALRVGKENCTAHNAVGLRGGCRGGFWPGLTLLLPTLDHHRILTGMVRL